MKAKTWALAVGLSAASAGVAQAADNKACLQSLRIYGWEAPNDHTLIVTDYAKKKYKVALTGVCTDLDNTKFAVAFVTLSGLSCVGPGDRVRYRDQTFGPQQCYVREVTSYTPPPKDAPKNGAKPY